MNNNEVHVLLERWRYVLSKASVYYKVMLMLKRT